MNVRDVAHGRLARCDAGVRARGQPWTERGCAFSPPEPVSWPFGVSGAVGDAKAGNDTSTQWRLSCSKHWGYLAMLATGARSKTLLGVH